MAGANPAAEAVLLLGRAEKLEETLATTRATLAQHVEENLALHRRCAELEEKLAAAEALCKEATDDAFETEQRALRAEARVRELESKLETRQQYTAEQVQSRVAAESELARLRERVAELSRANCLLLAAHPIVARSTDQGLRRAISHHLSQRECGFEDREPSNGQ